MPEILGTVGRYEIVREIGRGGMATVFLARQIDLDRYVALKQLLIKAHRGGDDNSARRFLRESRLAGSLAHPNIVTVFDFVESEGTPYIAMELMPRGSLRQHVTPALTLPQKAGVLADTLAGLAYAERQGIVHRDLKPENLMVTGEGGIKIADFGIAKAAKPLHTNDFRTATGTTMGTPGYMAPEQAMAQEVGPYTDLYSLGCIAYELFAGAIPFADADAPMAMLLRHINEPIPPAHRVRPEVTAGVSEWIDRLLVKDPADRTRTATTALDELDELMIDLVGPRWRRDAGLTDQVASGAVGGPWTPPPHDAIPYETYAPPPAPVGATPTFVTDSGEPGPVVYDTYADPPSSLPPTGTEEVDAAPSEPVRAVSVVEPAPADLPEPPPAADPRPRRVGVRRAVLAGVAVVATGVAVAASQLPGGGDEPTAAGPTATPTTSPGVALAAGPLGARTPSGWKPISKAPELAGLELRPVAAAAPAGDSAEGAVAVGLAPAGTANPTLLPVAFEKTLETAPQHATVALGDGLHAYRYAGLRPRGLSGSVDLYVMPTSAGVAVVACFDPPAADAACRAVTESLRTTGATAFAPGPDAAYARTLGSALAALEKAAATGHKGLARATADEQRYRSHADALGRAFAGLARALRAADVKPADKAANAAAVEALDTAAGRYRSLGSTARRAHPARSRTAASRAANGERAAGTALDRLLRTGYADLVEPRLRVRSVPALKRKPRPAKSTPVTHTDNTPTATPTPTSNTPTTQNQTSTQHQPVATSTPKPKATPVATARPPVTTEG